MPRRVNLDFGAIRDALKALPPTSYYTPGEKIELDKIVLVPSHRAALDPDRTLVVGNRGVGKSFWTHVLADPTARSYVAKTFPELGAVDVMIGFNASERVSPIAPTENAVNQAFRSLNEAESLWRAVLMRVARESEVRVPEELPRENLANESTWVRDHGEEVDRIITDLDDRYAKQRKKLVLVFDALDRLGPDWETNRVQTMALLKRALAARSYRSIRFKLFMRRDQFEDPLLFQFADGSKVANQRVDLLWSASELYTLLFSWLEHQPASAKVFAQLKNVLASARRSPDDEQKGLISVIAGEFMGATAKQGRVYTWLPLHLSDARGETSPRTFLTAWREAAQYEPEPLYRAVDYRGIHEGVRKASRDRLQELDEDYWWISLALQPLRGQQVPMDRSTLKRLWTEKKTTKEILEKVTTKLPPVQLHNAQGERSNREDALIEDLRAIGIIEIRPNNKINIPDIFRLWAGIKRKGGVAAPQRAQRE